MIKELQLRVAPNVAYNEIETKIYVSTIEDVDVNRILKIQILKRSIDARQRKVMVNLKIRVFVDEFPSESDRLGTVIDYKPVNGDKTAIVVGAGPGGLFASLRLIELGVKPILLERGKNVVERAADLARISRDGTIDSNSNYCFGEGGAGAYSDGKLYTRSKKRGNVDRILSILHQHGASEDILVDAHPHIGTDKLPKVIENIRKTIIGCGGEVHFSTCVDGLIIEDNTVKGVTCGDLRFEGPVVLATGHSARDVYEMLKRSGILIEPKGIAVGVRLEHPQQLIDKIQYHSPNGRGKYLPAAEYSFVTQVDGRGVYSFCMCPGGFVVPAASAPGQLVVNGMSPSSRSTKWSNSGMVVEIHPGDFPEYDKYGELSLMRFQEDLEKKCFEQAKCSQKAGAQRMKDFVDGKPSETLPASSFAPGIQPSRLDLWLPKFISHRLREGFKKFGKMSAGFLTNEAIVIGVETRTSSPVRIPRNREDMSHAEVEGLYPCGEGAGYAGGIVSAAIDGEKCAEALVSKYFAD